MIIVVTFLPSKIGIFWDLLYFWLLLPSIQRNIFKKNAPPLQKGRDAAGGFPFTKPVAISSSLKTHGEVPVFLRTRMTTSNFHPWEGTGVIKLLVLGGIKLDTNVWSFLGDFP